MKKWSEIKQATLNKLFLDEEEARQQGYLEKFQYLANECLDIIANGVKPRIATFEPEIIKNTVSYPKIKCLSDQRNDVGMLVIYGPDAIGYDVISQKWYPIKDADYYYDGYGVLSRGNHTGTTTVTVNLFMTNGDIWSIVQNQSQFTSKRITDGNIPDAFATVKHVERFSTISPPAIVADYDYILESKEYDLLMKSSIPDTNVIYEDSLTHELYVYDAVSENLISAPSNIYRKGDVSIMPEDFLSFSDLINYRDGIKNPELIYITDREIKLPDVGKYKIFYNARWHDITQEDIIEDNILPIDASILNTLPTYMASQLLSQDDVQRSTILKNEFELMLARLDTNIMYQQNSYVSEGGWY